MRARGFHVPLHQFERRLVLFLFDLGAVFGALLLYLTLRPDINLRLTVVERNPVWFFYLGVLWLLTAYAFDAYDLRVAARWSTAAGAVLKAAFFTNLFYLMTPRITPTLPDARRYIVIMPVAAFVLLILGRSLYILVLSRPAFARRALIVGTPGSARTMWRALEEQAAGTYQIVGFVVYHHHDTQPGEFFADGNGPDTGTGPGETTAPATLSLTAAGPEESGHLMDAPPVLGTPDDLHALIPRYDVSTLILADLRPLEGRLLQILMDCLELGVDLVPMSVIYEQLTGRVPVEHVGDSWYVAMPLDHPGTRPFNRMVKRAMDLVLGTLGLIVLGLLLPFIALAIYLDSPGPIFYSQWRVGKGGRRFKAYKFRSMIPNAEDRPVWAKKNDPRVTRVGRFLRRTHLDEWPQFWNIVRGEMSVVGPRPERPEFVEELAREIPFYRVRHAVKPGMAGWALVKQGYSASKEETLLKLQYDLYYVKHQSLWLDLVILAKTAIDMVTLRGR